MKTVGIKQLKAQLSEYVREVKRGEVYLVTDRDTVVAELRPPGVYPAQRAPKAGVAERLAELTEAGVVTAPSASTEKPWKSPSTIKLPAGTVQSILDELREDRF
jgi:antitoxin (DNA-binding transcriptional repressor) of toxin-antitoxin stability system